MKNQWSRRTDGRTQKIANARKDEYPNLALDITRPIQLALDSNDFDYRHLSAEIETHHLPTLHHSKFSSSGAFYRTGMERGMAVLQGLVSEQINQCGWSLHLKGLANLFKGERGFPYNRLVGIKASIRNLEFRF
ncbi:hypothetical protein NPIL_454561 [Nephila pilipes]|uniref:Uncharacterized protein n=1 Tax=Nephila pilipes TaxID=299642 RepID=A0A8X6PDH6_NEPPI|nr:hypothetical protein NPIL_454561 [Nephila pilipes]